MEGQRKRLKGRTPLTVHSVSGGLGSPIAIYLRLAGKLEKNGLGLDPDVCRFPNLPAAQIRNASRAQNDVGPNKTEAQFSAKERITAILTPTRSGRSHGMRIFSLAIMDGPWVQDYGTWLIDGTDNFPTGTFTNDVCVLDERSQTFARTIFGLLCWQCARFLPPPPHNWVGPLLSLYVSGTSSSRKKWFPSWRRGSAFFSWYCLE